MINELMSLQDLTIDDVTSELSKLLQEKEKLLETLRVAVNEYVSLRNEYRVKSNSLRCKQDEIKEGLGLGKVPSEKQQQAYIDDQLKELVQELRISEENVDYWKRELYLLNDKIAAETLKVELFKAAFVR